jgi:hypothetical protein
MSSLEEIDGLFKKAQETIISGNPEQVRTVLWPEIKSAIATNTDLSREKRSKLTLLIPGYLDEQRLLQSEEKAHILSIDELMKRAQSLEERPPLWHFW